MAVTIRMHGKVGDWAAPTTGAARKQGGQRCAQACLLTLDYGLTMDWPYQIYISPSPSHAQSNVPISDLARPPQARNKRAVSGNRRQLLRGRTKAVECSGRFVGATDRVQHRPTVELTGPAPASAHTAVCSRLHGRWHVDVAGPRGRRKSPESDPEGNKPPLCVILDVQAPELSLHWHDRHG